MPPDLAAEMADFRSRAAQLIETARPDDMVLVVVAGASDAVHRQWAGTPRQMVDLASSLLEGALDRLQQAGGNEPVLELEILDALDVLPARQAPPADGETGEPA